MSKQAMYLQQILHLVAFRGQSTWGAKFVENFLDEYQVTDLLLKRVRFYQAFLSLMVAFEGLETGDSETFKLGLAQYQ